MNWHNVQRHIDVGRGKAGQALGPPCNVFRVGNTASGNYLDVAQQVGTGVRVQRKITHNAPDLETATRMETLFYKLYVDATFWQVGDVFVENDPFYGAGSTSVAFSPQGPQFEAYCLAFHGPTKATIAARVDRVANIYRPAVGPTSDSIGPYFNQTVGAGAELPLVLSGGVFSFAANGTTPTNVPVGVLSTSRTFRPEFKDVPGSTDAMHYFFYVPPLNGVDLREGDRILIDGSGVSQATAGRYIVHGPWVQYAGVAGYQIVAQRMAKNG